MLRALRLTAVLLAGLALPALAQTTATTPSAAKPPPPSVTSAARPAASAPVAMAGKKIDVNGGSESELASLPGIGPVTAKAIVAGRPWDDLGDLVKKKAVGQSVYEKNKDRFALANINSSSAADMAKTLPGIGDKTAPKIVSGRPYSSPQDLVSKGIVTSAQFDKIKNVVTY